MRPEIHRDHLDENSGWLTARYEIVIERKPEDVWEYAYNLRPGRPPTPDEHMGLVFYNNENRPRTGTAFYQKESVSGVAADLRGHILFAGPPNISGLVTSLTPLRNSCISNVN